MKILRLDRTKIRNVKLILNPSSLVHHNKILRIKTLNEPNAQIVGRQKFSN